MIVLSSESFWGIFDPDSGEYSLACIDLACPAEVIASTETGDHYKIQTEKYAMAPDFVAFSDIHLDTRKI
jgi:hypothetical protein